MKFAIAVRAGAQGLRVLQKSKYNLTYIYEDSLVMYKLFSNLIFFTFSGGNICFASQEVNLVLSVDAALEPIAPNFAQLMTPAHFEPIPNCRLLR